MTLCKADAIAQAITDRLNTTGGLLAEKLPATRKHAFEATLEDIARTDSADTLAPIITVFPRAERKTRTSRSGFAHEYDMAIAIQCYCGFGDTDRIDELTQFVGSVCDDLASAGRMANAVFMRLDINSIFDVTQLHERQQFLSIPQFTYRLER